MSSGPVDVLFAISDTGGGHRSAAVAISAALDEASEGRLSWSIADILRLTEFPVVSSAPSLYDQLSTRWLRLYDLTFQLTNGPRRVDMLSRLVLITARRNISRLLVETQPRVVVVTHPLVHRFVVAARQARKLPFRVITVVTDLVTLHASWAYPGVDLTLVPTDEAYELMYRRGIRPSRMQRTWFPVHPKFAHYNLSTADSRAALGVDIDRPSILLTSGGVGSGRLLELVAEMERAFPSHQLFVVTGKNRAMFEELQRGPRSPHSRIFGFVDNMEQLMAASDLVITKAGPGTLMEALVMRKPVIITEAVGMQERGNIDFVLNYELGMYCPTNERIIEAVRDLEEPERYAATLDHLVHAVPRDGSSQIARVVMEHLVGVEPWASPTARRGRRRLQMPRWGRGLLGRRGRAAE